MCRAWRSFTVAETRFPPRVPLPPHQPAGIQAGTSSSRISIFTLARPSIGGACSKLGTINYAYKTYKKTWAAPASTVVSRKPGSPEPPSQKPLSSATPFCTLQKTSASITRPGLHQINSAQDLQSDRPRSLVSSAHWTRRGSKLVKVKTAITCAVVRR